ncbi:MAG: hypothetical protein RBR53_12005 [Desulforegulaceae bacterium]|nr:hypothetical protein [Desulforegulaceae bacterium]
MANSESIKQYLIEGNKSYLGNDDNNGTILMLSGAWGSGKTHFWKNIIETDLIPKIKEKEKSYVFVSLYGKDSIKDIENEILQKAYSFLYESDNDLIKKASSVFTKSVDFIPKISLFGFEIDPKGIAKLKDELSNKEKLHKASVALSNGIVCFDDFERKSSKIDLNDLFGFITNLTENFQTKTIIILNQEFFQHHDTKVFNTVKEKSVNKFILYNPTIEELFDVIYTNDKYKLLDQYKVKILEAIQLSEEKNARIYIQVLNNCLEYAEKVKGVDERAIYLLTLVTVIFVKNNFIFKMKQYGEGFGFLPTIIEPIPDKVFKPLLRLKSSYINLLTKEQLIDVLKDKVSNTYKINSSAGTIQAPTDLFAENLKYISINENLLYTIYKYVLHHKCFIEKEISLLNKMSNFVESGILLEE